MLAAFCFLSPPRGLGWTPLLGWQLPTAFVLVWRIFPLYPATDSYRSSFVWRLILIAPRSSGNYDCSFFELSLASFDFRFIEKFSTHIIVGVKMGGKDFIYVKQQHSSKLQTAEIQKRLKEMADNRFLDGHGQYILNSDHIYETDKFDVRHQHVRFDDTSPSCSYSQKEVLSI